MKTDVEKFYTERKWLLKFTINVLNYLPALQKLWRQNIDWRPGMQILDIGCGTGALTKTLYRESQRTQATKLKFRAFDLTQVLLDEFRQWITGKTLADIQILKADIRTMDNDLPILWRNFDLACSSGVLEYLEEQELKTALWKIRTRLKNGGRLITMGSRRYCTMGSRRHWVNRILIQGLYQANLYDQKEFTEMLHRAGFQNIGFWKFPRPYSYLNYWGYIAVAEK